MRRVIVDYVNPPIPDRSFDFCATLDGYEPGDPIGYGPTAALAETQLRDQIDERWSA